MQAFCGFYGARADNKLFNRASTVVHTLGNDTPVITMLSEYRGSPAEFVMIVPTAKVLDRSLETTFCRPKPFPTLTAILRPDWWSISTRTPARR